MLAEAIGEGCPLLGEGQKGTKKVLDNAIYEKVWGRDVAVEMQQISYHKAQLLKKIRKVAPKSEVKSLITPVSGEGMVLNLRSEEIAGVK